MSSALSTHTMISSRSYLETKGVTEHSQFIQRNFLTFGKSLALSSKQQLILHSWLYLSNGNSLERNLKIVCFIKFVIKWNLLVELKCWTNPIFSTSSLSSESTSTGCLFSSNSAGNVNFTSCCQNSWRHQNRKKYIWGKIFFVMSGSLKRLFSTLMPFLTGRDTIGWEIPGAKLAWELATV